MFTTPRLIFIAFFVIAFVVGLWWAYRKDSTINQVHYRGVFWIFFTILVVFSVLFLIVKFRH